MKQRRRGCEWERVATAFILSWAQQWRDNAIKSYIIGNTCAHPHTHTFEGVLKESRVKSMSGSLANLWIDSLENCIYIRLHDTWQIYIYIEKIFIQSNPRQLSSTKRYTHKSLALWLIITLFVLLFCAFFLCFNNNLFLMALSILLMIIYMNHRTPAHDHTHHIYAGTFAPPPALRICGGGVEGGGLKLRSFYSRSSIFRLSTRGRKPDARSIDRGSTGQLRTQNPKTSSCSTTPQ